MNFIIAGILHIHYYMEGVRLELTPVIRDVDLDALVPFPYHHNYMVYSGPILCLLCTSLL